MNPAPNFNRLARLYRWMEWLSFGPWLGWCRCAWLHRLSGCRHALVLGDGDGRFTARLLAANRAITIDAVDASPAMLSALVSRAGNNAGRVRIHIADSLTWQPAHLPYDLVVTHFFLDCLTTAEVAALTRTIRNAVSPEALWVVSEFAIPDRGLGRIFARPVIAGLYWAFGGLTGLCVRSLPDHATALSAAGFELDARRSRPGGLLVSELWRVRTPPFSAKST